MSDLDKLTLNERWNERGFLLERECDADHESECRVTVNFTGQDPAKSAEQQAESMRSPCPECQKPIGQHTVAELRACVDQARDRHFKARGLPTDPDTPPDVGTPTAS